LPKTEVSGGGRSPPKPAAHYALSGNRPSVPKTSVTDAIKSETVPRSGDELSELPFGETSPPCIFVDWLLFSFSPFVGHVGGRITIDAGKVE